MEILFLSTVGRAIVPKRFRPNLRLFFEKTGRDDVPYHAFGIIFFLAAFITYFIWIAQVRPLTASSGALVGMTINFIVSAGLLSMLLFVLTGMCYFYLTMIIYRRTKDMEDRLPDYLTLVSTSLKGGYSFEKALWGAIKPEFGILAKEIGLVSKRVMTGNDVSTALREFSLKYDSPILRRSVDLIIGELESGGRIVDVIDRVILDLKKTKALKAEMSASTLTYIIFISALVMFVMPLLFALSFLLFNVITGFIANISSSVSNSPVSVLRLTGSSVKPGDFKLFTIIGIAIISTFSGMIISIIEKGDMRGGFKYIPMFLLTSLFIYFTFLELLSGLFGALTGLGG